MLSVWSRVGLQIYGHQSERSRGARGMGFVSPPRVALLGHLRQDVQDRRQRRRYHPLQRRTRETSTGWRMRLTLAVSMLKHADLVLLDEPTNHLDEESVEWLGDYVKSITQSSVMVISHEPKFLNKICTD